MQKNIHDVLIIGAGGAGLMAAVLAAKKGLNVAVISKVHPLKSHTIAAQGGINASLGNISKDNWRWHAYDTMKASCGISDQDSVEYMCKHAPEAIKTLQNIGVEFDLTIDGKIDQKIYGGQSTDFGQGELAHRACFSKDRTGHNIMHKLYEKAKNLGVNFYNFYFALDLLHQDNQCYGVFCWNIEQGEFETILGNDIIIATGGYSQIYATATSSSICTGDGNGLAARAGVALQDMEFVQFHPTAINKIGVLITEAARSAGGKLFNALGERFMLKYDSKFQELATRDVVARAIATEINEGRGCGANTNSQIKCNKARGAEAYINRRAMSNDVTVKNGTWYNKDHVLLDLTHLSADYIKENLPTIYENCQVFLNIDPSKELIPIAPAAHYNMGGIPTNNNCQVEKYIDGKLCIFNRLYAIGEAACISVHGAGRLGCNSLLDLIVFAKKAVDHISSNNEIRTKISSEGEMPERDRLLTKWTNLVNKNQSQDFDILALINNLQETMSRHVGIFRNESGLQTALERIIAIEKSYQNCNIHYGSLQWNVDFQNYVELGNMIISAKSTIHAALWRQESRGAHWRDDFPAADDQNFKTHSLTHENTITNGVSDKMTAGVTEKVIGKVTSKPCRIID